MRQIKFRAWIPEMGLNEDKYPKMGHMFFWYIGIGSIVGIMQGIQNNSVMQFTGLNDTNGKEIYEGDILKGSFINEFGSISTDKLLTVYFNEYLASFCGKDMSGDDIYWSFNNTSEIVGNIYENIELLK